MGDGYMDIEWISVDADEFDKEFIVKMAEGYNNP